MAEMLSASQLMQLPPLQSTQYVLEGLLRTGRNRPSLICGFPEAGKSTIARQLALAVAEGHDFLGRKTSQGHVIYWTNEDSPEDIRDDLSRAGMTGKTPLAFLFPNPGENHFTSLSEALVKSPDTKLVIVETLADFLCVPDISNNDDCRKGLQAFCDKIIKPNPTYAFVILHHFNKSNAGAELSSMKVLGSTAIVGCTDAKIFLSQVCDADTRRVIHATVRKGQPIEPTYLDFDSETLTATLGQPQKAEAHAKKAIEKAKKGFDLDSKILKAIAMNSGSSKWDVVKEVKANSQTAGKRIDGLIESGWIIETDGGEKGNARILSLPAGFDLSMLAAFPSVDPTEAEGTLGILQAVLARSPQIAATS